MIIKWREVTKEGKPFPNCDLPYTFNTAQLACPPADGADAAADAILECVNESSADWPDSEYYVEILEPAEFAGIFEVHVDYDPSAVAYPFEPEA